MWLIIKHYIILTNFCVFFRAKVSIKEISKKIAYEVALQAVQDKLALPITAENLQRRLEANFWLPEYRNYRRTSF